MINSLMSLAQDREKKIQELFQIIAESTTKLDDKHLDAYEKFKVSAGVEFLLVRLRTLVSSELAAISSAKSNFHNLDVPQQVQSFFIKREKHLISLTGRLTELREDLNSLQKFMYTYKQI